MIRDRVKELRWVPAKDLRANAKNWRRHPGAQRKALQGVLQEIGFADALIAREIPEGLELIDGHLRRDVSGNRKVPVLVVDLDEAEAGKLLATLDPLAAMAQPDMDALLSLLSEVKFESPDVTAMLEALANGEILPLRDPGLTDPDDVPEVADEPWVKRGDMFQLGEHRLACGEAPQDLFLLGDVSEALVLTDPPYGINIVKGLSATGGAKPFKRRFQGLVGGPGIVQPRRYYPVTGDDKPFDPAWVLTVGKGQIIFGAPYFATKLRDGTAWLGWDKGVSDEATFSGWEAAWTSFEGRFRLYRHRWSGMVRGGRREEELVDRVHPTQKPVGLFTSILEDFTERNGLVLDPFLGSGTTLIACEKLGRICYGMDIEPRYVQVALERWQKYTGKQAVKLDNHH